MQETTPPSRRIVPSAESRPSRSASTISGMRASKREMAMEGCTLTPRARAAAESAESGADTIAPHGSSATMASALYHEGYGPMVTTGSVPVHNPGREETPLAGRPDGDGGARCSAGREGGTGR